MKDTPVDLELLEYFEDAFYEAMAECKQEFLASIQKNIRKA